AAACGRAQTIARRAGTATARVGRADRESARRLRCAHAPERAGDRRRLGGLAFPTPATAQVVARATARTEPEVWAGPPSTLPANTDITGGATITSSFGSGGTSATATRTFSLARTSRSMLDESGNAATTGAPAFPAAGVGPRFGPPTHHEIEVELASATPTVVRLMVATCNEPVGGTYDGTLSVPGHGDLQNVLPTPCGAPAVRTLDLALGPTPTAL